MLITTGDRRIYRIKLQLKYLISQNQSVINLDVLIYAKSLLNLKKREDSKLSLFVKGDIGKFEKLLQDGHQWEVKH